jgi:hypothetical protein
MLRILFKNKIKEIRQPRSQAIDNMIGQEINIFLSLSGACEASATWLSWSSTDLEILKIGLR